MRIIAAIALALTSGCAHILGMDTVPENRTEYRAPCVVPLVVILAKDTKQTDDLCRNILEPTETDSGEKLTDEYIIMGCTDGTTVITTESDDVLLHEFRHVWDYHCAEEEIR